MNCKFIMKKNSNYRLIYVCLLIAVDILVLGLSSGCSNKNEIPKSKTDIYFDTVITITLYNNDEKYIDKCFELCDSYEKMFSKTIDDSEISQINENSKKGIYTTVSNETLELIRYGLEYSELSGGRFDITIGNLTALWDFGGDKLVNRIPKAIDIADTLENIDYEQIDIQGNDILITNPSASIDLGGIAKGYIADRLKEYLLDNNVKKGIINLGGNVLLIGTKPDGSNYNIGIQNPFSYDGDVITIVNTDDKSIVTSGVYERYFYENDVLYHHILDTDTGYPADNELLSVTIISDKSVDGDGLSTSAFLLGLNDGMKLIESTEGVEAIFIDEDYNIHLTSGLSIHNDVVTEE